MHREISHADSAFHEESNLPLYLMTALLGVLIGLDAGPTILRWFGVTDLGWWPQSVGVYRFALIAAVLGGARILYTSLQGLLEGRIGADLALAIACIAAILINEPLVAAEVVFIGMVGECLEAFTFARTQNALRKIVEVFPRRCWRLENGQEVRVFTSELKVGDRVVVKPGAKIPVDGVVLDGRSAVDTSALTGESLPQDKGPGDEVLAGSLNQFGALVIEARKVAEETVAGRVIELTARALKNKAEIERTADKMARYFLPIVLGLAAVTLVANLLHYGAGWFRSPDAPRLGLRMALTTSLYPTLSVLVVACPCALILATPAAIIAALGRLAGTGILIKSGAALERLAAVRAFAFDKTGTITEGRLELGNVLPLGDTPADEVLRCAASAEQKSEHPLARVILEAAQARNLSLDEVAHFQAHPGAGVEAQTPAGRILVGTRRLLEEQGFSLSSEAAALLDKFDAEGQTALLVARNEVLLGAIGARDRVRPEAAAVLAELKSLGLEPVVLLTGDRAAAAHAVARELPFNEIRAELLPEQKAEWVAGQAAKTAMVGDGINDAPALARADVGLAVGGTGADIAAEAGDVVFMGDPLRPLPLLLRLSRQTVRIIHQNIVWFAFVVNAVGIVLTAWLWPLIAPANWYEQSPLAAVLYHQVGSLAVLLNSMRLLWFERSSTSPAWIRFKGWLKHVDLWIDKHLDLGEFGHWLEHNWKRVLVPAAFVLVGLYLLSGWTIVRPDELAVVRRFGRPVADLEPGWYLRWPWPVESVTRVSQQVRVVEIGYRDMPGKTQALTWESKHTDEATMITADENLVEVLAALRYKVTSPRVYLFQVQNAEDTLRAAGESVLRTCVAAYPFQDLLTVKRAAFQGEVFAKLKARISDYGGLGIELEGLSLLDLHPPVDVVSAYDDVAKAMEERDQKVNVALGKAAEKLKKAAADAAGVQARARAAGLEKVKGAEGDFERFRARSGARGVAPALSDFRIFWDTVGRALEGRDMILVDSDRIKGQRNLFLVDPDQFRTPVPMFLPSERPPRAPFQKEEP